MAFLRLQNALRSYLTTKSVDPIVVAQNSVSVYYSWVRRLRSWSRINALPMDISKIFHCNTLKKTYENPLPATRPVSLGAGPPWRKSKPISPPQRISQLISETLILPSLYLFPTHALALPLLCRVWETFSPSSRVPMTSGYTITVSDLLLCCSHQCPALNTNIPWDNPDPPPPSPIKFHILLSY